MTDWTFGKKLGLGFAVTVVLSLAMAFVAFYALRSVVNSKDRVISVYGDNLVEAEKLIGTSQRKITAVRGFLLDEEERSLAEVRANRDNFRALLGRLRTRIDSEEERELLNRVEQAENDHQVATDHIIGLRKGKATIESVIQVFEAEMTPKKQALDQALDQFIAYEKRARDESKQISTAQATFANTLVTVIAVVVVLFATLTAFVLTRTLSRQIATAVGQVQSSSAELQAAANQQATGSKEQATAMNEITTTISELLATSRQISASSQRVAQIAGQTANAGRSGEGTVDKAHESISGIRSQVDLVVNHMLELGRKSQQIGSVVDIVSELADQTNILAINATIEATGAGETGKRFAVVADEIRKLADRVARSTKEIRGLIEDVRSAVNTTVMATETGSKAVDSGSQQFGDVASAFKQIAGLVTTTTEAAREIELSTKQQTTAVEQVNVAIANVAQASRETEASSSQTLQTASQLAALSKNLLRLVQPNGRV